MKQKFRHKPSAVNSPNPFNIRLDPIPFNERVAYVEHVCAILIESRFGPGRSTPIVTRLRKRPERGDTVFYDFTPEGPVPSYSIVPDSEMARRYVADAIRRELEQYERPLVSIRVQNISPSNQGRGSP